VLPMLSNMPPITCAMTIWLDQFLIGILIGLLLSAAMAAADTETSVAQTAAATMFRRDLDFSVFMTSFLNFSGARDAPWIIVKTRLYLAIVSLNFTV
jgi:hypothetical protein